MKICSLNNSQYTKPIYKVSTTNKSNNIQPQNTKNITFTANVSNLNRDVFSVPRSQKGRFQGITGNSCPSTSHGAEGPATRGVG